ncbi:MAG TPA: NlpC/P60 family protein [Acidobacteriota bacterium]|nr:NlpC/P60 family protein [Acidobacteriota bacterium]
MKRHLLILFLLFLAAGALASSPAPERAGEKAGTAQDQEFWDRMKQTIETNLGKPYVWGASGLKSFDCSGFVWRVMWENGILIKRTTARKFYMCLPQVPAKERWKAGNIVFFDDLKHCGIVAGPRQFYHSESSIGTNLSSFDPYWRPKIYGFRALPLPQ